MKSTDINAIFSAKVAEFLANGYQINTNTMGGSQGEVAKVDFRKGDELIRVLLDRKTIFNEHFTCDGIVLIVGRCTDPYAVNAQGFRDATIWNSHLEVIEERTFCKMGMRWNDSDWYLEGAEAEEAQKKTRERAKLQWSMERHEESRNRKEYTGEEIKNILLPAVRRHLERPKLKADRIDKIVRVWKENRFEYTVTTLGKKVAILH
jgi:hypothetical protein